MAYNVVPGTQVLSFAEASAQIDRLNAQAWDVQHSDPARSRELCRQARALLDAYADADPSMIVPRLADCLLTESVLDWDQSHYDQALQAALEAHALFVKTGNLRQQAFITNHMAGIYYFLGDSVRALELGGEALTLSGQSGDRILYASCLNDTAYIRLHLGQMDEALPQLQESLAIHREEGSLHGETQTLESLGKAYYLMGDYDQALRYELESLAINQRSGYRRAETDALHSIGLIHSASGDFAQADAAFARALTQARERGYRQIEAAILMDQGKLFLLRGEMVQAEQALSEALTIAKEIQSRPVIVDIYQALAQVYEQRGDHVQALDHFKQYHQIRQDLLLQRNSIILHSLLVRHQLEQARSRAEIYHLRNVELQRQIDEREALIADLNAFAYTVAHDLKNPLSSVVGYADLLVSDLREGALNDAVKYAEAVVEAGQKAIHIVDDLLLLASVRRQEITLQPVDLGGVVQQVIRRLSQSINDRQAIIDWPEQWPLVLGHAPWIEQVWINYLSNALKYSGDPPRIALGAERVGDMVRCWVRDNGDGIPPNKQPRLFTQFDRLDTTRASGHGIGLSIVKRIMDKLGGAVGVESTGEPGAGCVFSFTLPASLDPAG